MLTTKPPESAARVATESVEPVTRPVSLGAAEEAVGEKSANVPVHEAGKVSGANARNPAGESHGVAAGGNAGKEADGGSPAAGAASDGVRADDVRHYKIALATAARRFKRYPPLARERGWEGTAQVGLDIRANASPEAVLLQSSGHALLDEQAVNMLTQAARAIPLPPRLRARNFRIELPVRFSLDESF